MSDTYVTNSAGYPAIYKDDQATLDYTFDWSVWLAAITDTITSKTVQIIGDGVGTISSTSNTTTAVTVWMAGGTIGQSYRIECKIVTVGGRTDERSIVVNIRDR